MCGGGIGGGGMHEETLARGWMATGLMPLGPLGDRGQFAALKISLLASSVVEMSPF